VTAHLAAIGCQVGVVDDFSRGTLEKLEPAFGHGLAKEDVFPVDVTDPELVDVISDWRPEVVVHLAAQARVLPSLADPDHDARVNVLGTINVIRAILRTPAARLVLASSGGAVYGNLHPGLSKADELFVGTPISPYGVSKLAAELYATAYRQTAGLNVTTLRLGNVYGRATCGGPGEGVVAAFALALSQGHQPTIFGDGGQLRDYVHVRDVAHAFGLACRSGINTGVNIASGVAHSVNEIFAMVNAMLPPSMAPRYLPANPGEVDRICLDPSRAGQLLGWQARTSLEEGVRDVIEHLAPTAGSA
ncbi:MAG TPA: GDP-mannose 4,6-dehydratase, partial [Micromonosporaceae bacterium]